VIQDLFDHVFRATAMARPVAGQAASLHTNCRVPGLSITVPGARMGWRRLRR